MAVKIDRLPLSRLKGVQVYCEDDLHDFAHLVMKLLDARAKFEGSTSIKRPTVNGLAKDFAQLIEPFHPDHATVSSVLKKHGIPTGASIEFDDMMDRWK